MTVFGVDYSTSRPGAAALRAAGYSFACRYLAAGSSLPTKPLTRTEADQLRAGGIDIVSNWEIAEGAALKGHAQGVSDAQRAAAAHTACGGPPGRPIYFSVDIDTTPANYPAIDAYFAGIISELGLERTGVYGEYDLVKHCLDVHEVQWAWETYAWSSGHWDSRVRIRQIKNGITVNGADCDRNQAMAADFGQWGYEGDDMDLSTKVPGTGTPDHTTDRNLGEVEHDLADVRAVLIGQKTPAEAGYPADSPLARLVAFVENPPAPTGPSAADVAAALIKQLAGKDS